MRVDILTIFPEFFQSPIKFGMIKCAIEKKKLQLNIHDLRDYAPDRKVDDYPYGGGSGMILKTRPLLKAVKKLKTKKTLSIMLTPTGKKLDQKDLFELSNEDHLIIICGRYKGVDYRVSKLLNPKMISIGDYVLSGGEIGAVVLVDGVTRLIPGVLGDPRSAQTDSFVEGLLDSPYYTRPRRVGGRLVPKILVSGNHQKVSKWRLKQSLKLTMRRRPDLIKKHHFNEQELETLLEVLHEKK